MGLTKTCRYCGRSGWFLSVSANELCDTCEPTYVPQIIRHLQIIRESQNLVETGKTLKTKVGRCEDVVANATALLPFEEKGVPTCSPPPSALIEAYTAERTAVVVEHTQEEVRKILTKAELKTSPRTKINAATKAVLKLDEARNEWGVDHPQLDAMEDTVRGFIHRAELDGYLEAAEKAEFKGQKKKALDQYQEALYFLRTDHVPDDEQSAQIADMERKIETLREELDG